jgi:hypothetical protein
MRMAFAGIPYRQHFWGKVTLYEGFASGHRRSAKAGLRYPHKGVNRTVRKALFRLNWPGPFTFDLPPRGRGAGSHSRVPHVLHADVIGAVQPAMTERVWNRDDDGFGARDAP